MPFGSLSASQQIMVRLRLLGGPQYRAGVEAASRQTKLFAASVDEAGMAMSSTTKKSFLMNQSTFTLRRGLFYTTLALAGAAFGAAKLGLEFFNTMETSKVAFKGFIGSAKATNTEMNKLYILAAKTPFSFPDIVTATRRLLPFVGNLQLTNQLVDDLTNSLSAAGVLTGAALSRASMALSHMFTVGKLTGQILYQMGRDWIPMQKALEHYFHVSGAEIKDMVSKGLIPASVAAKALNREMTLKGFKGAAVQQATKTLSGAWSTFKDLVGMAAGTQMTGPLNSLTVMIGNIDKALIGQVSATKPLTIERLVKAIDSAVSPNTHLLINLYYTLSTALDDLLFAFGGLLKIIQLVLWPTDQLGKLFGSSGFAAKIFGGLIAAITAILVVYKVRMMVAAIWTDIYTGSMWAAGAATGFFDTVVIGGSWALIRFVIGLISAIVSGEALNVTLGIATGLFVLLSGAIWTVVGSLISVEFWTGLFDVMLGVTVASVGRLIVWLWGATAALLGFSAAEGTASIAGAILLGVIALGVGLVILYYRWKWFHNLVNNTWTWIKRNGPYIAAALTIAFGPLVGIAALTLEIALHFERIKRAIAGIPKWVMHPVAAAQDVVRTGRSATGTGGGGGGWGGGITSAAKGVGRFGLGNLISGVTGVPFLGTAASLLGFQHGGTVPGPTGAPQMIMAHGGETVIPVGQNIANASNQPIVVQLVVDRKVLAEQVARANQDYAARR